MAKTLSIGVLPKPPNGINLESVPEQLVGKRTIIWVN